MTPNPAPPIPFLKRIKIRNFKSIAYCDVELGPLTILVGRNGSGKSNFLDAIRFVGEILRGDLAKAIDARGGWNGLIHRPNDGTTTLSMQLTLAVSSELEAHYEFEIAPNPAPPSGYFIRRERLEFQPSQGPLFGGLAWDGQNLHAYSATSNTSLDLQLLGVDEPVLKGMAYISIEFLNILEELKSIRALNMNHLNFKEMRRPQNRSQDHLIDESGERLAEIAYHMQTEQAWLWDRLTGYLRAMVPTIERVKAVTFGDGSFVYLTFHESNASAAQASAVERTIGAVGMSDGTLRALATLLAINPIPNHPLAAHYNPVRLVGVEEPESGLHPAAAGVLMDALREAAESRQIVVTTQSDDLLDRYDPETDRLLVAEMRDGATEIAWVNQASRNIVEKQLFSAGEMLRMDQLRPDWEELQKQKGGAASEPAEIAK